MHAIEPLREEDRVGVTHVDAHVHLHPPFDTVAALDHAVRNMAATASRPGQESDVEGFLMLAETPDEDMDRRLKSLERGSGRWTARALDGGLVHRARRGDGAVLYLVRGRQVPTRQGLELLALATVERFPDKPDLEEAFERATAAGALPVLPWGFGKWWLGRGRRVREALDGEWPVLLGDNGGRWRRAPRPRPFDLAAERGITVLPGSDPLPFARQISRIGSYGVLVERRLDPRAPLSTLLEILRAPDSSLPTYGRRAAIGPFLWYQAAMQLRRRSRS